MFLVYVSPTRLEYITINLIEQNVLKNVYKQNEKNDVKLKYKIILTRTRMFWRTINIR